MSQKTEIKVYLPMKLVGELESKKRNGMRSKFIETAIRDKLRHIESSTMGDYSTLALLCHVRDRPEIRDHQFNILQMFIEEMIV